MGHTTGNVWNFVKLPEDATQIEVCLTACYPKIVGSSNKFYVGTGNEIYAALLRQSMPVFIISMLTLMVGLVHCPLLGYHTQKQSDRWYSVISRSIFDSAGTVVGK